MQNALDALAVDVTKGVTLVGMLLVALRYMTKRGERVEDQREALNKEVRELHLKTLETHNRVADALDSNTTAVRQLELAVRDLQRGVPGSH